MSTATSIIADTTAGAVQGVRTGGVVAFLGVPYAAAPVGERRFRAPEPVAPWAGVRDAVTHGPTAPMPGYPPPFDALLPNPVVAGDEYLNLSVWTPDPDAQGLPVLVWIHGGAFVNGSSAGSLWDGSAFARAAWSPSGSTTGWAPRGSPSCPTHRPTSACSTRSRRSSGCATTSRRSAATRTR